MFKQDLHTKLSIRRDRSVVNPIVDFFSDSCFIIGIVAMSIFWSYGKSLSIIGNGLELYLGKFAFTPSRLGR